MLEPEGEGPPSKYLADQLTLLVFQPVVGGRFNKLLKNYLHCITYFLINIYFLFFFRRLSWKKFGGKPDEKNFGGRTDEI